MSLPIAVIDRLFDRLASTYGAQWTRMWGGIPVNEMKIVWADGLGGYAGHLKTIAWALENLPERCPNLIEFRNLCRQAPAPDVPLLPEPKADPQRVATELAKLRSNTDDHRSDPKDWARRIIARHDAGEHVRSINLRFARDALGLQTTAA